MDRLDRSVQYRAISPGTGRNKTRKISIPLDMLSVLGWTSDQPIRIELVRKGEHKHLRLTQVNADECGLTRRGADREWEFAADERAT